jgi:hypothetical protein
MVPNELRRLLVFVCYSARDHAVALFVEALPYKLEGPGFDSRWFPWSFSLTILPAALWLWGQLSL